MKFMKLTLTLATFALAVASAASHYNLTLDSAQWAGDKQLKAGDYKVEVVGDKAVFTSGKTVVEVPATVQKSDRKYSLTSYQASDSKIQEIDLGGTNTKIVFGSTAAAGAAGSK
jgi:hypothetical protein